MLIQATARRADRVGAKNYGGACLMLTRIKATVPMPRVARRRKVTACALARQCLLAVQAAYLLPLGRAAELTPRTPLPTSAKENTVISDSLHATEYFAIPLSSTVAPHGEAVPLSVDDIAGFPGVVQIYRALRKAHGDQLGPPLLVGGEIRLGLCPSADLAPRSAEAIHASFICTAQELERNANREQPLPLGKVLSDAAAAKVLDAVSTATRKAGTQLFLRTEDSEFVVPTLAPEHFLEARQDEQVQRTDTFQVVGLRRGWRCEPHGLWVGENALPVVLPANDPRWSWEQIHDVLEQPTFLVGTLVRESRSSPWMPGEPSRLERQPQLAVASS